MGNLAGRKPFALMDRGRQKDSKLVLIIFGLSDIFLGRALSHSQVSLFVLLCWYALLCSYGLLWSPGTHTFI